MGAVIVSAAAMEPEASRRGMSLNGIITSFGAVQLQVTRTSTGTRVQGRYIPGAASTFNVLAGVEPKTGRELKDNPEGKRGDETMTVFSPLRLIPIDPNSPGVIPDVVRYLGSDANTVALLGAGEPWHVIKTDVWSGFGETHFECEMQRAPSPAGLVP
jgi:hypothetical protein